MDKRHASVVPGVLWPMHSPVDLQVREGRSGRLDLFSYHRIFIGGFLAGSRGILVLTIYGWYNLNRSLLVGGCFPTQLKNMRTVKMGWFIFPKFRDEISLNIWKHHLVQNCLGSGQGDSSPEGIIQKVNLTSMVWKNISDTNIWPCLVMFGI